MTDEPAPSLASAYPSCRRAFAVVIPETLGRFGGLPENLRPVPVIRPGVYVLLDLDEAVRLKRLR